MQNPKIDQKIKGNYQIQMTQGEYIQIQFLLIQNNFESEKFNM
jgi:hypothetical protein